MVYRDEAELMTAFRNGENAAFKEIYNQLSKPLYYYLLKKKLTKECAEDILASGFKKIYENRRHICSYEHAKRWLYIVLKNEFIDYTRDVKDKREGTKEFVIDESEKDEMDLELLKTSILSILWESIIKLPCQRQQVIVLYFFKGKTTSEVAAKLNIRTQTVLNHKTRGIASLRESFYLAGLTEKYIL